MSAAALAGRENAKAFDAICTAFTIEVTTMSQIPAEIGSRSKTSARGPTAFTHW